MTVIIFFGEDSASYFSGNKRIGDGGGVSCGQATADDLLAMYEAMQSRCAISGYSC